MAAQSDAPFTYDPSTPAGRVRLLISDTDPDAPIFDDIEIDTFLALEDESIRLAAAQALDTIASNEAMVLKVIRTQDLQTDGAKLSTELRARAGALRAQVEAGQGDGSDDGSGFATVGGISTGRWPEHTVRAIC